MASRLTWRFNGTKENGFIEKLTDPFGIDPPIYTLVPGSLNVYVSSSSAALDARSYLFFNTAVLPADAVIVSAELKFYVASVFYDNYSPGYFGRIANNIIGATLEEADFETFLKSSGADIGMATQPGVGFQTLALGASALAQINLAGYTNAMIYADSASDMTSSFITLNTASGWRSALDRVPRLSVTFDTNLATMHTPTPSGAAPTFIYNP